MKTVIKKMNKNDYVLQAYGTFLDGCFRISLRYFQHVNTDSDVDIIISRNKPPVLLIDVFIKKIQYRIILHP